MLILWAVIFVILCFFVWIFIPYSPLKTDFKKEYEQLAAGVISDNKTFSEDLLFDKPKLLQKYIRYCGLYGKPMMKSSYTVHHHADFLLNEGRPMAKIQYEHANFASICERMAFIDTKMAKILPFQGLDDNLGGKGRMRGVVGKAVTVFDVKGAEMDIAALVTVLAEGFICPSFLMNQNILWETLDDKYLKATLTQYKVTVSGIFEFDKAGAVIRFYTKDRFEEKNGKMIRRDWKVECGGYKEADGIKRPSVFKAVWIYPDCEKVYFDCDDVEIQYQY